MKRRRARRLRSVTSRKGRVRRAALAGLGLAMLLTMTYATVGCGEQPTDEALKIRFRGASRPVQAEGPLFEAHFVAKLVDGSIRVADAGEKDLYSFRKPPVDPIKANGPIFEEWPKPDVALMFTGDQLGYLEPCGCAGLENMKGGLKRRHTLVKQLEDQGWPLVMMDAGGHSKGFGPQPRIKLRNSIEALTQIGYQVVGLGDQDLRFELLSLAVNLNPNPLTSANVALVEFDAGFSQRYQIIEKGGMKLGVTQVLGEKERAQLPKSDELVSKPAEEALDEVLPELEAAKCDQLILLCYANADESRKLALKYPQFNWVVAGKGGG